MGLLDVLESVANVAVPVFSAIAETSVGEAVPALPMISSGIGAAQSGYQAGCAAYDAFNGDRDGAIDHGAQAAYGAFSAIPGLGLVTSLMDSAVAVGGLGAKTVLAGGEGPGGVTAEDVPQSMGEIIGQSAVYRVNQMFGKDDTNWIAPGDAPQGTRAGEITAGLGGLPGAVIDRLTDGGYSRDIGGLLGVDPNAKSSGVEPGFAARLGQDHHARGTSNEEEILHVLGGPARAALDVFGGLF